MLTAQKHEHLVDHVRTKVRCHVVDVLRGTDGGNVDCDDVEVGEQIGAFWAREREPSILARSLLSMLADKLSTVDS